MLHLKKYFLSNLTSDPKFYVNIIKKITPLINSQFTLYYLLYGFK